MKKVLLLSLISSLVLASGYKIPELSTNAVALSSAYVANTKGADTVYYNPANMAFQENRYMIESSLTYIHLPKMKYKNFSKIPGTSDEISKDENFLLPTFYFMTPKYGNFNFGVALVGPGGLSKRWDGAYASSTAQKFALKIFELNPNISYSISDKLAIGFGLRAVYTTGSVRSDARRLKLPFTRDLEGDSIDFGYNLALSYKPTKNLSLAATYRSNVNLDIKGTANVNTINFQTKQPLQYHDKASVAIPLPATLNLAAAYTFNKTTIELVYERVFWSKYKNLTFKYNKPVAPFDVPVAKNWKDSNTYRIGLTHQLNEKVKLMAGFAIDEAGAEAKTLGFELPDSDGKMYSLGIEYDVSKNLSLALSYLYLKKDKVKVNRVSSSPNPLSDAQGEFYDAQAHLLSTSFKYRF